MVVKEKNGLTYEAICMLPGYSFYGIDLVLERFALQLKCTRV